jgi:hypothetical protein
MQQQRNKISKAHGGRPYTVDERSGGSVPITKLMLLVILEGSVASQGVEELLQPASWSWTLVGLMLSESNDVGAGSGEDVLDVGLRETAVSAVA